MKTLKRKNRKLALGVKIASLLSCVAIASVGFAGWLIVGQSSTVAQGSVTAYTVSEEGLTFGTPTVVTGQNANIVFGKVELTDLEDYINYNWLIADSSVAPQNMMVTFAIPYTFSANVSSATLTIDFSAMYGDEEADEELLSLITAKYITLDLYPYYKAGNDGPQTDLLSTPSTAPFVSGAEEATCTLSPSAGLTGTLYIQITFNWGEAFDHFNPYQYFNGQGKTDPLATAAKTALTAINNVVNNLDAGTGASLGDSITYSLAISATVSTAS